MPTIRQARVNDVASVIALVSEVLSEFGLSFGSGSATDAQLHALPESYAAHGGRFWVATERAGSLLGCCGVFPVAPDTFELRKMYLPGNARGRGVGKTLLEVAVRWAAAQGGRSLVLDTVEEMTRAIAFYEAHGFVRDDAQIRGSRCTRGYARPLGARAADAHWQPTLCGPRLLLRPLTEADDSALFAAAADPLIWALHPDRERHTRSRFDVYFRSAMDSRGALAILDATSGAIVGSSRFYGYDARAARVEIGYTFLTRPYWGGAYNRELKTLMLDHAFALVDSCVFVVGRDNLRSRAAMRKIGGHLVDVARATRPVDAAESVVFEIASADWQSPRLD